MYAIVESTRGKRYMLVPETQQMYALDGTPIRLPAEYVHWAVIGHTLCLFDWQAGKWTPVGKAS